MRNFLIGLVLGVSLATGIVTTASTKGPRLSGASGPLGYEVWVDGEMVCSEPWVSVPRKVIQCEAVLPPEETGPELIAE